jgi:lipoprotein signal peptidase
MAAKNKNTQAKNKKKKVVKKERGTLLLIALILIVVHSLVAAILYSTLKSSPDIQRPWLITMMVVHFLANVAAAAGIYFWKKWGLYLYSASAIIALVAGLLAVGMLSVFYMVLPIVILGWLLRTKWDYFV